MKSVLQIGFGPLGIQIAKYIADKSTVKTAAVIDINERLIGKSLYEIDPNLSQDSFIFESVESAIDKLPDLPDVAIITTVSSLEKLIPQIEEVAQFGIPIISTCEELSYSWDLNPALSAKIDKLCKEHDIACLGTGVNPGFLMDYLPSVLSSICKDIESVTVERFQDATVRRIPFQQKIGAGLDIAAFKEKEAAGTLRHVGLKESIYLLANSIGFKLDEVTEDLQPVLSEKNIQTSDLNIKVGEPCGVEQIGLGYTSGECKIKMHFKAAVGESRSYDKVTIKGNPSFSSEIDGGINGDIATCAITINCINSILKTPSGLHTMSEIATPGFVN